MLPLLFSVPATVLILLSLRPGVTCNHQIRSTVSSLSVSTTAQQLAPVRHPPPPPFSTLPLLSSPGSTISQFSCTLSLQDPTLAPFLFTDIPCPSFCPCLHWQDLFLVPVLHVCFNFSSLFVQGSDLGSSPHTDVKASAPRSNGLCPVPTHLSFLTHCSGI